MREVKEKSPLKERTVKTLKSAPQTAFRRGTDASFQQFRQELREAAQDGQPEVPGGIGEEDIVLSLIHI